jgi:hypothetical protein
LDVAVLIDAVAERPNSLPFRSAARVILFVVTRSQIDRFDARGDEPDVGPASGRGQGLGPPR